MSTKVFMTAKVLANSAKKLDTASKVFEMVLLSAAYQLVMTGQVGMVAHIKATTAMRGYGAAGKALLSFLKVTDQQVKAGKLGEKGKAHFAELREDFKVRGSEQEVYDYLKEIAFRQKAESDKPKATTQEKVMKYLGKIDITELTTEQAAALRAFTATLVPETSVEVAELAAGAEPAH